MAEKDELHEKDVERMKCFGRMSRMGCVRKNENCGVSSLQKNYEDQARIFSGNFSSRVT